MLKRFGLLTLALTAAIGIAPGVASAQDYYGDRSGYVYSDGGDRHNFDRRDFDRRQFDRERHFDRRREEAYREQRFFLGDYDRPVYAGDDCNRYRRFEARHWHRFGY